MIHGIRSCNAKNKKQRESERSSKRLSTQRVTAFLIRPTTVGLCLIKYIVWRKWVVIALVQTPSDPPTQPKQLPIRSQYHSEGPLRTILGPLKLARHQLTSGSDWPVGALKLVDGPHWAMDWALDPLAHRPRVPF